MSKCKLVFSEVEYSGYKVAEQGIRPGTSLLLGLKCYPEPRNHKELHSFMGLCSYFRKFIQNFSTIAHPLQNLLKKNATYDFNDECRKFFKTLIDKLVTSPVLSINDPKNETELHCDESKLGFGGALLQRQNDQKLHPQFELQTLAIISSLRRFRVYLQGIRFTIITDCNLLAMTLNKKEVNAKEPSRT